ncbi:MAG: histidine kinase [Comamonadaceae bacterium]|nr:MAG: histidine kinase [Comamonadaceae bacterium]
MNCRVLGRRAVHLVCGWALAWAAVAAPVEISQARASFTVGGVVTVEDVALGYHWDRRQDFKPGTADFEMVFELPEPTFEEAGNPYGLYFDRIGNAADIYINGLLLGRLGNTAASNRDDFSKSPQYVAVPPRLLQRVNSLRVHIRADSGRRGGLSKVIVGPEVQVLPLYKRSFNSRIATSFVVMAFSLLVGTVAMALWFSQFDPLSMRAMKRDALYLCAAVAEFCWALRVGDIAIEHPPLPWPWWGVVVTAAFAGWIVCIGLFCHHVAGWHRHHSMPLFRAGMWALFTSSIIASSLSYLLQRPVYLTAWLGCANLFFVVYGSVYLWTALRQGDKGRRFLAIAGALNVAMGVRDWLAIRVEADYAAATWIRYSSILFGMALGYIVIARFRNASVAAHDLRVNLESRVLLKEVELQQSYMKMEMLASEQARAGERARILRDMHDGVGSHISSAIRQLQSGKASNEEVLLTLRDSLDQLKLSIDSMNLPPGDITAMLANLRYRLEPRFAASDIELQWDVDLVAPVARVDSGAMRQLQFMVFEALSNVLQHAQASTVRIEARPMGEGGVLRIIDNGRGFDTQQPLRRGLHSMRERALSVNADLSVTSEPGRSVVEIRIS